MDFFIHPAASRRQFIEFAESEIGNGQLARGALLIALEDQPQIDVEQYLQMLDDLASRVALRSQPGDPPIFRVGHLHAEMFDVDRYEGDREHYYDPRNAYLNEVIDRRCGLPITLSIIFLHVATRLGLKASGVGLPGHFVVKVQFPLNEIYIDPFNAGATMTVPDLRELVAHASSGQVQLVQDHLRSWDARSILTRVLGNLENMWTRMGDLRKAAAARERRILLDTVPRSN